MSRAFMSMQAFTLPSMFIVTANILVKDFTDISALIRCPLTRLYRRREGGGGDIRLFKLLAGNGRKEQ